MSEGTSGIFRGIRPVDWVLAGALTALGIVLMLENVGYDDASAGAKSWLPVTKMPALAEAFGLTISSPRPRSVLLLTVVVRPDEPAFVVKNRSVMSCVPPVTSLWLMKPTPP